KESGKDEKKEKDRAEEKVEKLTPKEEKKEEKKSWHEREERPGVYPTAYGYTGTFLTPSADKQPHEMGAVVAHYISVDQGGHDRETINNLHYDDYGGALVYGIAGDFEASLSFYRRSLTWDNPGINTQGGYNSEMLTLKYAPEGWIGSGAAAGPARIEDVRYALGVSHYRRTTTPGSPSGLESGRSVTRWFAVASAGLLGGIGHFGIYSQTGRLIDDSKYDGFGFMGAYERKLDLALERKREGLSIFGEYDHRAYYLMTLRTPVLGIRYYLQTYGTIQAGVVDLFGANGLTIGGSFLI
ncbi:MAG: hypothetical protein AB1742_12210, partial [bacterium]